MEQGFFLKKKLFELAVIIDRDDDVAIAKADIAEGTVFALGNREITIQNRVPQANRFALVDIPFGQALTHQGHKYGISKGIKAGQLINKDNVEAHREDCIWAPKRSADVKKSPVPILRDYSARTFFGFIRKNGLVGTRNYYAVVPTSLCASDVAIKIAQRCVEGNFLKEQGTVDGIIPTAHTEGCGCSDGVIIDRLLLTLRNTIDHPNVGGALIVDLGCEKTNRQVFEKYLGDILQYQKPIAAISITELGGTGKTIEKGLEIISEHLAEIKMAKREKVGVQHLVVGTKCGASNSFSGITANPLIGSVMDKIIACGASGILSETPEMLGAEECLLSKMRSREVANKFNKGVASYKELALKLGVSMEGNFVPGNDAGGLINSTLKSLGAIQKGGSSEIVDFLNYGEKIERQGLNIMDGPGNDLESMTGMVASGATLILFSTGLGTTEGNSLVPVIKIPSTSQVFNKMADDMDFNAGRMLDESISLDELSDGLFDLVVEVASGKKVRAEYWGKRSFQIWTAGKLSL